MSYFSDGGIGHEIIVQGVGGHGLAAYRSDGCGDLIFGWISTHLVTVLKLSPIYGVLR